MEKTSGEKLTEVVGKWQTAYYLSQSILEDYATVIEKLTGDPKKDIKERIIKSTNEKMEAAKKELAKE